VTHRLAAREERCVLAACDPGRVRANDGAHCCWPGQVSVNDVCRGVPASCPPEHVVVPEREACEALPACAPNLVRADDGLTCCYPGQHAGPRGCMGAPTACPEGSHSSARAQTCVPDVQCEGGRVPSGDYEACCWPGQRVVRGACAGPRTCPDGLVAEGDTCVRVTRTSQMHAVGPVFAGVGVGVGALAVLPWFIADRQTRDLAATCMRACPSNWRATADQVRTLDATTTALAYAGGALAATGLVLMIAVRTETEHRTPVYVFAEPGGLRVLGSF